MSEPAITIGVPLHNGATHLRECLACLQNQTFQGFQVLIFENKSTDNSLQIAEEFVRDDSRFSLQPSSEFLSAIENFKRAIVECSATSEYFLLRAHDDLCDPEFLQALFDGLESDPSKRLAVFNVQYVKSGETFDHQIDLAVLNHKYYSTFLRPFSHLRFPASWYYGLFRGAEAGAVMINTLERYPYPWGADRLLVLKLLLKNQVTFCPNVIFKCTLTDSSQAIYRSKTVSEMVKARYLYYKSAKELIVHQSNKGFLGKLAFLTLCFGCARRHTTYSTGRIFRRWLQSVFSNN